MSAHAAPDGLDHRAYARCLPDVEWIADHPWQARAGVLRPLSMPHVAVPIDRPALRRAMRRRGALLAVWTTDWDGPPGEWWYTCCDRALTVDAIPSSNVRRDVRSGLRKCAVRRVDPGEFGSRAYPVLATALLSKGERPPGLASFLSEVRTQSAYPGTEYWAAFVGDVLVAYSVCQRLDGAVALHKAKSLPEYHHLNPNPALFFSLASHYAAGGARYVTNGSRALLHPTAIHEFLERHGFRRIHARLQVERSFTARWVARTHLPRLAGLLGLRRLAPRAWARVEGFEQLGQIEASFGGGP